FHSPPHSLARCVSHHPAPTHRYTLSLHDALPILTEPTAGSDPGAMATTAVRSSDGSWVLNGAKRWIGLASIADVAVIWAATEDRSEEHTSELQSRFDLVCRLLLEKKKHITTRNRT